MPIKILCRIVIERIKKDIDKRLRQKHAGFRQGRVSVEQIFTLRSILEQYMESQVSIYVNFVDIRRAFGSLM